MKETNKKIYVGTEIEIICFSRQDVILTSGGEGGYTPGPDSSDTDYEGGIDW